MKRRLLPVLGLATAYCITGKLGLLLAIPPGYSTPVWPPSGIALAGLLLLGNWAWPGVLLGSFAANAGVGFDVNHVGAIAKSVATGAAIGLGASAQALVGATLIRRSVGFPSMMGEGRDVLSFLLIGSGSCLVNATVGPTILLLSGALSLQSFPFNWFTWWVGDALGVLVVTPIIFTFAAEPRHVWGRRRLSLALPLCLILAVSVALFIKTRTLEQVRMKQEFERRAMGIEQAIMRRLEAQVQVIETIALLYDASFAIDRQQFGRFVAAPLARSAGIQAIEWVPRVTQEERAGYEEAARRDGLRDFEIRERDAGGKIVSAGRRDVYFPVSFIEPLEGNEKAVGFDMGSDPERRAALEEARDSGRPIATAITPVLLGGGPRMGVVVFMPVYRPSLPHDMAGEWRQHVQGFAVVVLRLPELLESALAPFAGERIQVALRDVTARGRILFTGGGPGHAGAHAYALEESIARDPQGLHRKSSFEFGGRDWVLELTPSAEYLTANRNWQAWTVLATTLLFTGLLGALLLMMTGRTARIEQLVEQRTIELANANRALEESALDLQRKVAELARSNADLEQFAHVASHDLQEPLRMVASYTELLADRFRDRLDADGHRYVHYAVEGARRMQALIEGLLSYSRVGREAPALAAINCSQIVGEVVDQLKMAIEESGGSVAYTQLPTVRADGGELGQVFHNLIANAMKFRAAEPPHILIGAKHRKSEWQFSVSDNGIGFEMEYSDRIFQIFKRLHTRREYAGSGIGLAICKRIIDRHGGRIWAQSVPGKGSTFYFTLPDGLETRRTG